MAVNPLKALDKHDNADLHVGEEVDDGLDLDIDYDAIEEEEPS